MGKLTSRMYKTIRLTIILLWILIGIVLVILATTIGDSHMEWRPLLTTLVKIYVGFVPVCIGVLYVLKRREHKCKENTTGSPAGGEHA